MTDSVLDWDSLWDRVERTINIDDIDSYDDFKQQMINTFFKS